jgi:hypothetical protein
MDVGLECFFHLGHPQRRREFWDNQALPAAWNTVVKSHRRAVEKLMGNAPRLGRCSTFLAVRAKSCTGVGNNGRHGQRA